MVFLVFLWGEIDEIGRFGLNKNNFVGRVLDADSFQRCFGILLLDGALVERIRNPFLCRHTRKWRRNELRVTNVQ